MTGRMKDYKALYHVLCKDYTELKVGVYNLAHDFHKLKQMMDRHEQERMKKKEPEA